jgi:glycosyltransferase involved in cell wall biosynthesis
MKKVLLFIDWYLPGYKAGGPVTSCVNLTEHLKPWLQFYIVTRNTEYCENQPYNEIETEKWNKLSDSVSVFYLESKKLSGSKIRHIIQNTEFDILYVNGIYSYYFSILPVFFSKSINKKIIVASRGMLAQSAIGVKKTRKILFLMVAKCLGLYKSVIFHATNEKEKYDIITTIGSSAEISIAPNFPKKNANSELPHKIKYSGELKLISIARIAPEKNILYALKLLQNISEGEIVFDIFGSIYNQQYWADCEQIIQTLNKKITVNYYSEIHPSEINNKLKEYHFLLLPTQGENFGHIILESMQAGCPVIISDQTPWKNLPAKNAGWDIPLSQTAEFVSIINKCVTMDQAEYEKLSYSAFVYSQEIENDKKVLEQNLNLFSIANFEKD